MNEEAQQAEIEALQKRFAQASAEFAEKIRVYEQAAVNPALNGSTQNKGAGAGAPPAITEEAKKEMRREAVRFLEFFLDERGIHKDIALLICECIYTNKIPHVRFVYD